MPINEVKNPRVYIVLLNYRGAEDTLACLESLKSLAYNNYHIIVVENDSQDGSADLFRQELESGRHHFHLIVSEKNLGYSGGNNLAIRYALEQAQGQDTRERPEYIWLLNNDTTVETNALEALVAEAQRAGGIVGSLVMYPDRTFQQVGTRVKWSTGSTKGIPECEVQDGLPIECLTGASMLIPLRLLEKLGLLDESYFLYFEDGEFTLRVRRAGFPATLAIRSRVYHKEGASTGRKSLNTQYYYHRNRLKMLMRYASFPQKPTILLYTGFRLLRTVVKCLLNPTPDRRNSLWVQWLAVWDFIRGVQGPCPHNFQKKN